MGAFNMRRAGGICHRASLWLAPTPRQRPRFRYPPLVRLWDRRIPQADTGGGGGWETAEPHLFSWQRVARAGRVRHDRHPSHPTRRRSTSHAPTDPPIQNISDGYPALRSALLPPHPAADHRLPAAGGAHRVARDHRRQRHLQAVSRRSRAPAPRRNAGAAGAASHQGGRDAAGLRLSERCRGVEADGAVRGQRMRGGVDE